MGVLRWSFRQVRGWSTCRFEPPVQLRDPFGVPDDGLVMSMLFFHGMESSSTAYQGELPYGLSLEQTRPGVKETLDPRVGRHERHGNVWEFDRREVRVDFTDGVQHIKLLTIGLLRSGKRPDRPLLGPRRSAATAALIRRVDAEQDWRRWDSGAWPVPFADGTGRACGAATPRRRSAAGGLARRHR